MSPTTVFAAAAKCMSSHGGAFWDWPPSTPDIDARQLFLTLPSYMPTAPPHRQERSPLRFNTPLLVDLCCNKSNNSCFLCCRERERERERIREIVCLVSARRGVRSSSQHALSLSVFISFCLLCCFLGKEVKLAFALQVLYVGVYKWHYKQILL